MYDVKFLHRVGRGRTLLIFWCSLIGEEVVGVMIKTQPLVISNDSYLEPFRAPRGAVRFLELVRVGLYNGVVLNRVVPKFLTQFGIAKDYEMRTDVMKMSIWDDFNHRIPFEAGYVSFAGSGHDSRTSEIFIVMPDVSKAQLENFGENSWETPFGFVEGDLSVLNKIYSGYGDMVSLFEDIQY